MMKRLKLQLLFIAIVSGLFLSAAIQADTTAENFAVYNIRSERFIFYKMMDSFPDNTMVIVNFTSINCPPCRKEIPELKKIADASGGKVRLICIYAEAADSAGPSAESLGIRDNAYVDPFAHIQKLYNVKKYPVTFIIDMQHKILGRFEGYTPGNINKIKKICGI